MKFRTILAIAAAAAASVFALKAARDRLAAEEDVTLELSPEHVASYDPETDTVTPAPKVPGEEEETTALDPLAAAPAVDFNGKGSKKAPKTGDAGEDGEVDPMKLAQSDDFSGDWENIDCKG